MRGFSWLSQTFQFFGGIALLLRNIFVEIKTQPFYWNLLVRQIYEMGWKSIPIVLVTAASSGMVLSLQFGLALEKYGMKMYIPKLLSLAIFRELGPVFTSLILAGRLGAGIAAEIGAMKVTQQIDALVAMGVSPIKRIVIPCFLGGIITIPLLCVLSCVVSVICGSIVGYTQLNLDYWYFLYKVLVTTEIYEFFSGYIKTYFFATFITLTACYFGLQVKKGTNEVGNATTKSVVISSLLILSGDYLITKLYWMIIE